MAYFIVMVFWSGLIVLIPFRCWNVVKMTISTQLQTKSLFIFSMSSITQQAYLLCLQQHSITPEGFNGVHIFLPEEISFVWFPCSFCVFSVPLEWSGGYPTATMTHWLTIRLRLSQSDALLVYYTSVSAISNYTHPWDTHPWDNSDLGPSFKNTELNSMPWIWISLVSC